MTSPFALSWELQVAAELAEEAGRLAVQARAGDLAVAYKDGHELVTAADLRASALIVAGLTRRFPRDLVISEEAPDPRGGGSGRSWLVDPIDGTIDYARGEAGFAVMIGLCQEGRPVLGVVYQPVAGRLYLGAAGWGARLREGGQERDLHGSGRTRFDQLRLVGSRSRNRAQTERLRAALGTPHLQNIGSVGVKVGLIAAGEADLYVSPARSTKAWDTCAPEAILTEAGGRFTDAHGELLAYDGDLVHRQGLVASNGAVHGAVIELLRESDYLETW